MFIVYLSFPLSSHGAPKRNRIALYYLKYTRIEGDTVSPSWVNRVGDFGWEEWLKQVQFLRFGGRRRATADPQFSVDALQVSLDGVH